jgi:8-oxo-dGTP pyrophosphatase MutT (NUDIX family)
MIEFIKNSNICTQFLSMAMIEFLIKTQAFAHNFFKHIYIITIFMYKIKYIKYKNKYLELAKQLEGYARNRGGAEGDLKAESKRIYCHAEGCKTCILPTETKHSCFVCKTQDSNHLRMNCPLALTGCQTPDCNRKTGLWVCMECGFIGCGRLGNGNKHAENHYKAIGNSITHNKMIEIGTQKVWDYNPPFNKFMGVLSNNSINFPWGKNMIENTNIIETGKITSSTISIIWNGKLLCGLRGVGAPKNPSDKPTDKYYGHVYTQGGSIDDGETPLDTAIREAKEEAGIDISLYRENIKTLGTNYEQGRIDFYCIIPNQYSQPIVNGPEQESQWEVLQVNNLAEMFESQMILNKEGINSGLSWVSIDKLIVSEEDKVKNSPSIKILKKIIEREKFITDVKLFFERNAGTEMTLYIGGDKEGAGKSSACYSILSTLVDIFQIDPKKLAYIKPVTQSESPTLITDYCSEVGIDCIGRVSRSILFRIYSSFFKWRN